MEIEIVQVDEAQKSVLRQMLELYEYEFSRFNDNDINDCGYYGYRYFDHYWTEPGRHAFFIKVKDKYAGFAMVNDFCYLIEGKAMAEFFVMLKYRRQGVGSVAAAKIFSMFPGNWEVIQHGKNHGSKAFWETVVHAYTKNQYEIKAVKTGDPKGQAILFNNSAGALTIKP